MVHSFGSCGGYIFSFHPCVRSFIVTLSENTTPAYSQYFNCISLQLSIILDYIQHKLHSYTVDKLIGVDLLL